METPLYTSIPCPQSNCMSKRTRRSPFRWLALPWWAIQLITGAKSFRDNPLIGSKRLNGWGLHKARVRIAHGLATHRRRRLGRRLSAEDREQFARQGYLQAPNFLPPEEFEALKTAILRRVSPAREMVQGDTITRRIAIDQHMLRDIPALKRLIRQPRWAALMRYVASFDIEPLYYIQTILTHRVDAAPDPQTNLHADTFHPTMKAWFFLTDVAEDEGPLTYVPGSHELTQKRLDWEHRRALAAPENVDRLSARGSMRVATEDLIELGLPGPTRFSVPANTLVVADTCGFHARGPSVRPSMRIEIWAYSRRNPFIFWSGLDIFSLPWIAERRIPALWAFRDIFVKWIGQPWRKTGRITANTNDISNF